MRNELAEGSDAPWLLPVDDDDVLDHDCVETLLAHADGHDVVYPWCRMEGRTDGWVPNKLWSPVALYRQNYIPVTALIRRELFETLGGYRDVPLEDWDFYKRAEAHGAQFKCVPEVLWTYRAHEGQTYQREAA